MFEALKAGHPVTLDSIERFVDGAAVKRIGDITFSICKDVLDDMRLVPEGKICSTILKLYNDCLLYTSDAADERSSVDLGGRRIIKQKTKTKKTKTKNKKTQQKRYSSDTKITRVIHSTH